MKVGSSAGKKLYRILQWIQKTAEERRVSFSPSPELLQHATISFPLQLFQYSLMQSIRHTYNLFSPWNVPESRQIWDEG